MYNLKKINKKEYDSYVVKHDKSHFLQSVSWGEFSLSKKHFKDHYVALYNDDKIVSAALLLEKKLPLGYTYFYSPRGLITDYNDQELFDTFTKEIIKYIKKFNAIFLKIDPDIIRKSFNFEDKENVLPYNPDKIFNMIKKAGYKHLGFTKNFETNEPRYSFRIDMNQSLEEIESKFSKTTKQRISKAEKIGAIVEIGEEKDVKEFYKLMALTEDRKDFVAHPLDYYEEIYKIFNDNKNTKATLFMGKINFKKTLKLLNDRLDNLNTEIDKYPKENLSKSNQNKVNELVKQKDKVLEDINKYKETEEKYGKELILSGHMILSYGDKAWVVYAGNHNELSETYVNYLTYYNHIKYCKEHGIKMYDQFGTIGDLRSDNPILGLHEFKKKFGGDYVEFLGEFDYITNKLMYFAFTKLVPMYRKIVRKKNKENLNKDVKEIKK